MNLIILVSLLTLIDCRPQAPGTAPDNVQIEKQEVHLLKETTPRNSKLVIGSSQNTTSDILPESTRINAEQGSKVKTTEINSRSVQITSHQGSRNVKQHFQFPENPFHNPIFDYINRNPLKNIEILPQNIQSNNNNYAITHMNPQITQDDVIPGQYIKRKVTHQQTMVIPMEAYSNNVNYYNPNNFQQLPYQFSKQQFQSPSLPILSKPVPEDVKESLENQTIENVKNIINTQFYPTPSLGFHNQLNSYPNYQNYPFPVPYSYGYAQQQSFRNEPYNRMYPEFYQIRPNRQWQWPLAQYFPIHIKDPVQQIVNAFTSMVEYGEQANANCAPQPSQSPPALSKNADDLNTPKESINLSDYNSEVINAAFRTSDDVVLPIEPRLNPDKAKSMNDNNESEQLYTVESSKTLQELTENDLYKNVNNVDPGKLAQKFNINEENNKNKNNEKIAYKHLDSANLQSNPLKIRPEIKFFNQNTQEKHLFDSNRKKEDLSIFSKDNTGNGIFIHRLKVNHGGVAIAGPGGVATAGHGGTAIVGPNGIAFTQPDSIAIAGSGAKVVAVNPNVNLTQLIESTSFNRNNFSSRIGKVVAIGPVIYYNKG